MLGVATGFERLKGSECDERSFCSSISSPTTTKTWSYAHKLSYILHEEVDMCRLTLDSVSKHLSPEVDVHRPHNERTGENEERSSWQDASSLAEVVRSVS